MAHLKYDIEAFRAGAASQIDYEIAPELDMPYRRKPEEDCHRVKRAMLVLNHERIVSLHAVLIGLQRKVTDSKVDGATAAEATQTFGAATAFVHTRADFYSEQLDYYITQNTSTCRVATSPGGMSTPKQEEEKHLA